VRHIGSTTATGAALRWARDLMAASRPDSGDYDMLTTEALDVAPGAGGLFFLPHLMGERGPVDDPAARGALVGLTLAHRRAHAIRAVIEGTAFQLRHILEERTRGEQKPARALVCGGAARSALWLQIIADVTRLPLRVAQQAECAAWGAAQLAASAVGLDVRRAEASAASVIVRPDEQAGRVYDACYARYRALQEALAPWFHATDVANEVPIP
jgi:xylulokinase